MAVSLDRAGAPLAHRLAILFRVVVGGIFLISGLAKLADPVRFLLTLREFQLLPGVLESFLAVYLPWLEFLLGLCLVFGILHRTASLLIAGLNGFFIVAIGSVMARGIEVDCGCFGLLADVLHLPDMADGKAIVRNLILMAMCLHIFRSSSPAWTLENYLGRSGATGRG
jgi:putative oxidoreductase